MNAKSARAAAQHQLTLGGHALPSVLQRLAQRAGPGYHLICGDSQQVLPQLPDGCADLVFADPPYRLSSGGTTCRGGERVSVDKGTWDTSQGLAADHEWNLSWLRQVQRILKPSGTVWVSGTQHVVFSLGFAMQSLGYQLLNTITWYKPNASPNLGCRQLTHSTELILWAAPAAYEPPLYTFHYEALRAANGGVQLRDLWTFSPPAGAERTHGLGDCSCTPPSCTCAGLAPLPGHLSICAVTAWEEAPAHAAGCPARPHPTQKPLALLARILAAAASPGHLVVDPFNGSGTTGVAALAAGCQYVGVDVDDHWLALTQRRIAVPL